jgi:hypothetical protein
LVQVTELPAGTVSVAGTQAKLSMLPAWPATGAAVPVGEALVPAGGADIGGMPVIPGIPGVVAPDPKVTDGGEVAGGCDEQPANSIAASSTTPAP